VISRRWVATGLDRAARARRSLEDRRSIRAILSRLAAAGIAESNWAAVEVHPPRWSPRGVTVAVIGPRPGDRRLAVKISHDEQGAEHLAKERDAELAIRRDGRLTEWSQLVPQPVTHGRIDAIAFFVETFLPGRPALALATDAWTRDAIQAAATRTISVLHDATRERLVVTNEHLTRWIDDPSRSIEQAQDRGLRATSVSVRFRSLFDDLKSSLHGRSLATSSIHGDYWLGNILIGDHDAPSGIIDWDRFEAAQLPWHDVLHLLLFTRRMGSRLEVATIVQALRANGFWSPSEAHLMATTRERMMDDSPADDALVLLYWLRHTAATLALYPALGRDRGYRAGIEAVAQLARRKMS
jgi:aminoglycoside phosphotransferase (APT) family kinase protein